MLGQTIADGILTGAIIALGAIGVSFGLQILRFANFAHSELITWGAYLELAFVGFFGSAHRSAAFLRLPTPYSPCCWPGCDRRPGVHRRCTGLSSPAQSRWRFPDAGLCIIRSRADPAPFGCSGIRAWNARLYARIADRRRSVAGNPHIARPDFLSWPLQSSLLPGCTFISPTAALALRCERWPKALPWRGLAASKVESVIRWTWMLSGALAAMAGIFLGLTPQLHPEMGSSLLLELFAAAILGGVGSLPGAVHRRVAGGLSENVSALAISTVYKTAMPFILCCLSCSSVRRVCSGKNHDSACWHISCSLPAWS